MSLPDGAPTPAAERQRRYRAAAPATQTTEHRAVVTWEGPGEPIMLTVCGSGGEAAVRLLPKRALVLAQELLTRGVQAIRADSCPG